MKQAEITIIIPTSNNVQGLKYLLNYFKDKPYQLIVVDNQPSDSKRLHVQTFTRSNVTYLPQSKNLGFAAAVNLGAKYVKTEWMLILNDDIGFLELNHQLTINNQQSTIKVIFDHLLDCAQKNHWIAISPVLKKPTGEVENCGYQVLPYGRIKLITTDLTDSTDSTDLTDFNRLDGLTAACLLIKTEVFRRLGGFDERFFAYLEDVDFFLRLKKQPITVLTDSTDLTDFDRFQPSFGVCPHISVTHHHMITGKTLGKYKNWLDFKNWILLILKHPQTFLAPNEVSTKWGYITNFFRLIIERFRNLYGLIKSC